MPGVIHSDSKKYHLYQMITDQTEFNVGYRRRQCNVANIAKDVTSFDWRLGVSTAPEKPRHILIALQQDKSDSQVKNVSVFDNLKVTQMSVILNNTKYPSRDVLADFVAQQFIEYYRMFSCFSQDHYGIDQILSGSFLDAITYKKLFPIFYFNVSKQSETFDQSVVDVIVCMKFGANIPDNVVGIR